LRLITAVPTGTELEVETSEHGTTRTITATGEIDLASVDLVRRAIAAALSKGCETLVLDLGPTTFADSTVVRVVMEAEGRATALGARLVVLPGPKQGQVLEPLSFGCLRLTPIGATYCALCIRLARAFAVEPTPTDLTPKSFVKMPFAFPLTCTEMVSFATRLLEIEMSAAARPPPFLLAYCCASEFALAGS